ncbi:MAG: alkane 1-monooxygenase [Pseudomonadota bacterium]
MIRTTAWLRLGHLLPFAFLASVPLGAALGGDGATALPAALLAGFVAADCLIGRAPDLADPGPAALPHRLLPWLYIPLQLGVIVWSAITVSRPGTPLSSVLGLAMVVGALSGIFGLLAAHEMVHSRDRRERALGALMLTAVQYRHFRIAHLYGHHRLAATELDPTTARRGESAYHFLGRAIVGQLVLAYRFERRRLADRWHAPLTNRIHQDLALGGMIAVGLAAVLGWRALLFYALHAAIAVSLLELFNYIAHYGLLRRKLANGKREPMQDAHSWNSRRMLNNFALFNMGHHSHHHRAPSRAYQRLRRVADSPELPCGYAGTVLLALLPPLWRRIMDPRIDRYCASAAPRTRPPASCSTTATRS